MTEALKGLKRKLEKDLAKQSREGLSRVFNMIGCKGVAGAIEKGEKVSENAEFGVRHCIHNKLGPRVSVDKTPYEFHPMKESNKELEKKFIEKINLVLINGGYKPMPSNLEQQLQESDKKFEQAVKARSG